MDMASCIDGSIRTLKRITQLLVRLQNMEPVQYLFFGSHSGEVLDRGTGLGRHLDRGPGENLDQDTGQGD